MIIQFLSDIHLDDIKSYPVNPFDYIEPIGDILILAGDISSFYNINLLDSFIEPLTKCFKLLLYIPGNHEYYYYRKTKIRYKMKDLFMNSLQLEKKYTNFYYLNCSSILINNICIAGCTLWTSYHELLPHYIRIHDMNVFKYNQLHNKHLDYLKKIDQFCVNNKHKLIIVTHHCPLSDSFNQNERKINKEDKKYNKLYYSNVPLSQFKACSTWIYGHTHNNIDIKKNNIRIISNQKKISNYYSKTIEYSKKKIIYV